MTPHVIAKLDRLGGTPACFILTGWERLRGMFGRRPPGRPRKILFVKLIEMGSTVLACPAFQEATRLVGRENIYILVFRQNRAIVDLLPYFRPENVLTIDDCSLGAFLRGLLKTLVHTRREGIDTAIDMEGLTRASAVITYLTGASIRVGYHNFTSEGPYRGRLFTREVNYSFQHHVSRSFLALVRALSAPPDQVPLLKEVIPAEDILLPSFEPTEEERETVRGKLEERSGRTDVGRIAILNPNCSDLLPLRRWPDEKFVELGRRLLAEQPGLTLVLTGAPSEQEDALRLAAEIGPPDRVLCLAGHTSLRELLVLYTMAEVLVSNDSGPCHFAALTPIRVVSLFGPETPQLYAPLGKRVTCISAGLNCSPCVNMLNHRFSPCTDNRCMQAIGVDEVYRAALG